MEYFSDDEDRRGSILRRRAVLHVDDGFRADWKRSRVIHCSHLRLTCIASGRNGFLLSLRRWRTNIGNR